MGRTFSGTSTEAERVQIEGLRSLPIWSKLQLASDLTITVRELALAGLRQHFPSAAPEELHRRLATLWLGPKLAARVYGPEPEPPTVHEPPGSP